MARRPVRSRSRRSAPARSYSPRRSFSRSGGGRSKRASPAARGGNVLKLVIEHRNSDSAAVGGVGHGGDRPLTQIEKRKGRF